MKDLGPSDRRLSSATVVADLEDFAVHGSALASSEQIQLGKKVFFKICIPTMLDGPRRIYSG
jgi:hypothetical protein